MPTIGDIERRLEKVESHVPEDCVRHDEVIKTICGFMKEIKGAVKWALFTTVGAAIVAVVSTVITGAMARCQ